MRAIEAARTAWLTKGAMAVSISRGADAGAAWVDAACAGWRELLIDHANCEKKAASSALALIFAYPEDPALTTALSRLAREELRHFEQVSQLMRRLEVPFERQKPGRYAAGLRAALRRTSRCASWICCCVYALIEARSCERFGAAGPAAGRSAGGFYESLQRCEARHFELYLRLARGAAVPKRGCGRGPRLAELAAVEAELITAPDECCAFTPGRRAAAAHCGKVAAEALPLPTPGSCPAVPGAEHDAPRGRPSSSNSCTAGRWVWP